MFYPLEQLIVMMIGWSVVSRAAISSTWQENTWIHVVQVHGWFPRAIFVYLPSFWSMVLSWFQPPHCTWELLYPGLLPHACRGARTTKGNEILACGLKLLLYVLLGFCHLVPLSHARTLAGIGKHYALIKYKGGHFIDKHINPSSRLHLGM